MHRHQIFISLSFIFTLACSTSSSPTDGGDTDGRVDAVSDTSPSDTSVTDAPATDTSVSDTAAGDTSEEDAAAEHDVPPGPRCGTDLSSFPCAVGVEACLNYSNGFRPGGCQVPENECDAQLRCDCILVSLAEICREVGEGAVVIDWVGP